MSGEQETTFDPMDDTFHAKGDVEKGVARSSLQRFANLADEFKWRSIISSTEHIDLTEVCLCFLYVVWYWSI